MEFSIQPILKNDKALLLPLKEGDFENLYHAASDPLVWEQHPNKSRYQREIFEIFFKGAMESKGAFLIQDAASGEIAGSTRYYDYDPLKNIILIGYTFYARKFWGTGINTSVKKTMLDYIFQYVDQVHFHIGANNIRSQTAITRLGAEKVAEINVAYYGEPPAINFVYQISKTDWSL
jgi:RimJ/RimL family protein N-acetyltransferase